MGVACKLQVEAGVVYQDECVGMLGFQLLLGTTQVGKYLRQMSQDFAEPHVGHFAIVDERCVSRLAGHEVASEKDEIGLGVDSLYCGNQLGRMYVAGGLTG